MKWIDAKENKPTHDDIVIVAMWRPELGDYMHFIAIWDKSEKQWLEHGDGEDMEANCGYDILWWSDIKAPKKPNQETGQ